MKNSFFIAILLCIVSIEKLDAQSPTSETTSRVRVIGVMRNVMMKGQLQATINIDTISNKSHLYGLGPEEFLSGEILIINGKSYKSEVINDQAMKVTETFYIKAPFFAYANVSKWIEVDLPDSVLNMHQFESFLDHIVSDKSQPLLFRLVAAADNATIHVVNLPKGKKVASSAEAHTGKVSYDLSNEEVEVIGFYSTGHKAVFTHHDTNMHAHLITSNRQKMGHLDALSIKGQTAKLYLQAFK